MTKMPPTISYKRGDILLVPFPFSDQTSTIPHFFYNFLDRSASNLTLHYPFSVFNVSTYFAFFAKEALMGVTTMVLLVLLACQLFLFVISIWWQPEGVKEYFEKEEKTAITLIDLLANRFAIPLGFLGTVVSVWFSLENLETDLLALCAF